ncbi:MAG TPA: arsenic resistance N-acetyltransferase ArsN2 [Paludibacter sp.]|nr:arsenic resistance N-acetyltransferase ArsN2 [Paludibacter sp.]
MKDDDSKLSIQEKYAEIAKKSLVRVQYSCSGNSTCCEESDFINYRIATVEDLPEIVNLLAECKLPYLDIVPGKQNFVLTEINHKIIGCAGLEIYNGNGLFRSLAVKPSHQNMKIGRDLLDKIITLSTENNIKQLYLLTTTADLYFKKHGWKVIERSEVPDDIRATTEFSSICPSTAICMMYKL